MSCHSLLEKKSLMQQHRPLAGLAKSFSSQSGSDGSGTHFSSTRHVVTISRSTYDDAEALGKSTTLLRKNCRWGVVPAELHIWRRVDRPHIGVIFISTDLSLVSRAVDREDVKLRATNIL